MQLSEENLLGRMLNDIMAAVRGLHWAFGLMAITIDTLGTGVWRFKIFLNFNNCKHINSEYMSNSTFNA
jgi:hypothetical protein